MKKVIVFRLTMALMSCLSACGGTASGEDGSQDTSAASSEQSSESSGESEETSDSEESVDLEEQTQENKNILVAYFSWSGNTRQMAQMIQTETGGDLFEIEPAESYTEDYDTLLDVAQQEQTDDVRPELASQVENWDSYQVVFVGYPDWWGDAPMLIYSFLESYDWEGKTLIPFCTSGGSGFGRSLDRLPDSAPGAEIEEGLHIPGSSIDGAEEEVASWIDGMKNIF